MGVYLSNIEMPKGDEMLCINIFPDGKVASHFDLRCMPVAKAVPAADVRPVVRGRWIKHNATHVQKGGMYLECSCCHEYITVLGHVFDYCPNCGADMRELPKVEI